MSILEAAPGTVPADVAPARPPYRRGDQICATSPEGDSYQVRVETVIARPSGDFTVVGVVVAPRKFRSHVITTVVGADGFGPAVRPLR
jgi:hypothetical protein